MIIKSLVAAEFIVIMTLLVVPLPRQKPPEIDHQHTEQQQQPVPVVPPPVVVAPVSEEVQQPKEVQAEKQVSVQDLLKKFSRIEKKLDGVVVTDERAK